MEHEAMQRLCRMVEEINQLAKILAENRRVHFTPFRDGHASQVRVIIAMGVIQSPEDIVCPREGVKAH